MSGRVMHVTSALNTSTTEGELSDHLNDIQSDVLLGFAISATVLITCIVLENLKYLHNHFGRGIQIQLGLIMCIFPVFCIASLITILVPSAVWLAHLFSELYLSCVSYTFLLFTTAHWGCLRKCVDLLAGQTLATKGSLPFFACWKCHFPEQPITAVTVKSMIPLCRIPMLVRHILVLLAHLILWIINITVPDYIPRLLCIILGVSAFLTTMVAVNCLDIFRRTTKKYMKRWNVMPSFTSVMLTLCISSLHDLITSFFVADVRYNRQTYPKNTFLCK